MYQLREASKTKPLIEMRVPRQHTSVCPKGAQSSKSLFHQSRTDTLPLKDRKNRQRPNPIPAWTPIRNTNG